VHAESGGDQQGSTFVVELPLYRAEDGVKQAGSH